MNMRDNFAESGAKKAKVRASVLTSKKPAGTTAVKRPAAVAASAPALSKPSALRESPASTETPQVGQCAESSLQRWV